MIEELLPSDFACVAVRDDSSSASPGVKEMTLADAVAARMREFAAARRCAQSALCKLGLAPSPIARGPKGEPVWPPGVVGSITHCRGYHAAAVAKKGHVLTVGIDAEIHDQLPPEAFQYVVADQERDWLANAPGAIHWDRVLFSAKESVYKAWFPLTGRWLNFKDVVVTFEPAKGLFRAGLLAAPPTLARRGLTGFTGRFAVREGLVLTAVVLSG